MCGITGIVSPNTRLVSRERIEKATASLAHRGPEGEGFYTNPEGMVTLGHRRLCIIDLSPAASQPFSYGGRYHIVFNGELYNYIELRSTLEKKAFGFRTQSDTEVVVAAFAAWGSDCLAFFEGAYAFAIWDQEKRELFAARDRMGEKPLFFYQDGEQLVFASEMKALWEMGIPREVNRTLLYNFLSIGYTNNPSDPGEVFFQGIRKLPAASFFRYSPETGLLQQESYWQVEPVEREPVSEKEAIAQFHFLLGESTRKRLRSDVPVGTSLSGGLDSSAVVAFCGEQVSGMYAHRAFTAVFPGFERDESAPARKVSEHFGLEQTLVDPGEKDLVAVMEQLMWHQEEPIASASALAQYAVYEAAGRQGVKVLVDGQGADEILAGYHKYYPWYWLQLYREKQLGSSGELKAARALGVREPFGFSRRIAALVPELATALLESARARKAHRHPDLHRDFAFQQKRHLYYATPAHFTLNSALYFNSFVQGLEELLRLADRNSMAHGVELRLPFLDHRLVEYVFSLPASYKIHQGWTKWILRKSVEGKLPEEITWRKDKLGFEPPQEQWMRDEKVQASIRRSKEALVRNGILDPAVLRKKIQPHRAYVAESREWKYWSAGYLFLQAGL
ncbi:MAG: asparagine synthase (glutamine-hydrolyzing) [Flavisolibacter sp.]